MSVDDDRWQSPISPDLPAYDPSLCVFINCPYDSDYRELRDALILCIVACGLQPRMAIESDAVDVARMDRIAHALFTSDYSIHDLSRYQGEGEDRLARFNMPLELGMALARRYASDILDEAEAECDRFVARVHRWLVLVIENSSVDEYVSDLKAFDPLSHDGSVEMIVPRALKWLGRLPTATAAPSPAPIIARLDQLRDRIDWLESEWAGDPPLNKIIEIAREEVGDLLV